jgi:hypothetical protein
MIKTVKPKKKYNKIVITKKKQHQQPLIYFNDSRSEALPREAMSIPSCSTSLTVQKQCTRQFNKIINTY